MQSGIAQTQNQGQKGSIFCIHRDEKKLNFNHLSYSTTLKN